MELIVLSFFIQFVVLFVLAVYYIRRDRNNFIQPHAFYSARVFILLLAIPFIQFFIVGLYSDMSGVVLLNSMIALSYISFSAGFFTQKKKSVNILSGIVKGFDIKSVPKTILNLHLLAMVLAALALFVYLTHKSGFGLLSWLLDPREGYQNHRTGLGHLYVGSLAIWNFIFLYILFFKVRRTAHLIMATVVFILILYFYGSKGLVILTILEGTVYYNFFIKKVSLQKALLLFVSVVIGFVFIFSLYGKQNTTIDLGNRILRYADYYNNARKFYTDFDDKFEHTYGKEYLSGLWNYVPRAAYPDKPFSYGIVKYVVEKYYPGAGDSGHTPAFGGPVEEYLNFGFAGVIAGGFIGGYFSSLFYQYFLKYRNFIGFVLFSNVMGFSIFPIIHSNLYKVLWYVFNILLLLFHKQIIQRDTAIRAEY